MPRDRGSLFMLDDDGNPVREDDVVAWGRWYETADRIVRQDLVGEAGVSTVFLGMDMAHFGGPPVLYETRVFYGPLDGAETRYQTRDQALAGHADTVELVRAAQEESDAT